jgi:hypothetical protein
MMVQVSTLRDRDLGGCPRCNTKIQFRNALVCYPLQGKKLGRFPSPEECSGADIHCPACELVIAYRRFEEG